MSVLIKNGQIITADADYTADIFIEGEQIKTIGKDLKVQADKEIDASGKLVFPGGIDPHVHLDMPFMGTFSSDNYETGTRAALFGGTTMVIDFILQKQGNSLRSALEEWQSRSNGNCVGDYSFHMAVTDFNENTKKEIQEMIDKEGITSFKTFMAYKGALMIDDRQMVGLMQEVKKSQPEVTEAEASGRFADMANYTGCPGYIVHLTCEGALNAVRNATRRNQKVFVETCIQYLILDASLYEREDGAKWVMSPPLREKKDQETLWAGINQGLVQVVATDHCPFNWEQKLIGKDDFSKIPNGHPAIENRMELLYSEGVNKRRITLNKYVEVACTNPAKIFGMFPRKGTIAVGSDADIVIFDPKEKHTISAKSHHMNVDYSGYEGWELTGKVKTVLLRGKVAIENNHCKIDRGYGKFIKRNKVSQVI